MKLCGMKSNCLNPWNLKKKTFRDTLSIGSMSHWTVGSSEVLSLGGAKTIIKIYCCSSLSSCGSATPGWDTITVVSIFFIPSLHTQWMVTLLACSWWWSAHTGPAHHKQLESNIDDWKQSGNGMSFTNYCSGGGGQRYCLNWWFSGHTDMDIDTRHSCTHIH